MRLEIRFTCKSVYLYALMRKASDRSHQMHAYPSGMSLCRALREGFSRELALFNVILTIIITGFTYG